MLIFNEISSRFLLIWVHQVSFLTGFFIPSHSTLKPWALCAVVGSWCLSFGPANSTQVHFSPLLPFSLGNLVLLGMGVPKISDIKYLPLNFVFPIFILGIIIDLLPFIYFAALRALYGANFLDTVCPYLITLLELKGYIGKSKFFWTKFSKAASPKSQPPVVHAWNSSASVGAEKAKQKDGKPWTKCSRGLFWFCFGLLCFHLKIEVLSFSVGCIHSTQGQEWIQICAKGIKSSWMRKRQEFL